MIKLVIKIGAAGISLVILLLGLVIALDPAARSEVYCLVTGDCTKIRSAEMISVKQLARENSNSEWSLDTYTSQERIEELCSGEGKYIIGPSDFEVVKIYKNKSASITICHLKSETTEFLTTQYLIKYNLGKENIALHMDAEVMTWGAEASPDGHDFAIKFYWPSEKSISRSVKEYRIACADTCSLFQTCNVGRLKSDIPFVELAKYVTQINETKLEKYKFIDGANRDDQLKLDQLFAEALTGNKVAVDLIDRLALNTDGASATIMYTYKIYLDEMEPLGCQWAD